MYTKLFDIDNGVVIPTEHCYTLGTLKNIMDKYPDNYLKIYQYLFYMTCPSPDSNPFFHTPEIDFSTEDEAIRRARMFCDDMYSTATSRAYKGMASMLDRLARYMETTPITAGRDGNINSLVAAAKNFDQIRLSFKGVYKDLQDEQSSKVRGGIGLSYDS
jgi:hypothetical protein